MYINRDGLATTRSAGEPATQEATESSSVSDIQTSTSDPGFAPISPDTPSWGPPSGSNDPGFAPISPDTPSWGPPSGSNDPGFAPISPNTPSWGPPSGSGNNNNNNNNNNTCWGPICGNCNNSSCIPSSGIIVTRPIIITPGQSSGSQTGSSSGNIRFLHAAAGQPAVTIQVGNRTLINNMQFGNSTPYYLISTGQNTLVTVINTRTGATMYQRYLNFANGTAYTISIINDGSGISLFTLVDTPCSSRNSGCLRAVNLSPNSGAVDIFLAGYGRIFQGVSQLGNTGYRQINQGTYRALVSEALPCSGNFGITIGDGYVECNNTKIAIMDSAMFNVMPGVTYTLYIIGRAYQFPALQILPLESDLVY